MRFARLVAVGAVCAAVLASAACGGGSGGGSGATEMNMCNFAGDLGTAIKNVAQGFEKKYNVHINWCTGVGSGSDNLAKVVAAKNNQTYDATLEDIQSQAQGSAEGAWATLDPKIVDTSHVYPSLKAHNNDSVPIGIITNDLYYNKDTFAEHGWGPPTSYQDLLDPKYCNQVGILDIGQSYGLYTILGLGGLTKANAAANNLEPAFQAGLGKLAAAKGCFPTLEASSGGLEQKMQTGQYAIGTHGSVRVLPLIKKGAPLGAVIPKEGAFLTLSFISPVKNGPHPRLTQEFCNYFLTEEAQTQLMKTVYYGPTVDTVKVSDDLKQLGVVTKEQIPDLVIPDVDVVTKNRAKWTDDYQRQLG